MLFLNVTIRSWLYIKKSLNLQVYTKIFTEAIIGCQEPALQNAVCKGSSVG